MRSCVTSRQGNTELHAAAGASALQHEEPKTVNNVPENAPVVLSVQGLNSKDVKNVSFDLHKGEILGFAGLMGAGRTEVARLIFGADPKVSGKIYVKGEEKDIKSPQDAVAFSIGYLSEDRKRYGLATGLSVADNMILVELKKQHSYIKSL